MIWMDVDTALAAVPVNNAALIDDTDFKSREESVTYDQAGMDLVWNFVTTAGAFTQTAVTPTTAGDYDWTNKLNGMYSIEITASGGASINNDTEGFGWFTGFATGVLPWKGPIIGFRAAALNNALIDGGDTLDVNVTAMANNVITAAAIASAAFTAVKFGADFLTAAKIADAAFVAANFAASSLDGKGDWNTVVPPTEAQMNARTIVSANYTVVSDLGTVQSADHTAGIADIPTVAEFNARTLASADYVVVGDTLARVTLVDTTTALTGKTGFSLAATGLDAISQAATGMVEIAKAVWDRVLTAATHNIATSAGRRLRDVASDVIITGTSPDTSGTANTAIRIELDSDASSTDGAYDPANICITGGTGVGQSRQIFEYDGTNKYAYINRSWKVIPDNTSTYTIYGSTGNTHVNEGLATGGGNTSITLNSLADSQNNTYKGQSVFLFAGTGEDQERKITAYNGTSKVATVDRAWVTNPVNGATIYAILPTSDTVSQDITIDAILALLDDARGEPGQGAPPVNPDMATKIDYLYKFLRNKKLQTATLTSIMADDDTTTDHKSTVSDDGTTSTIGKMISGA